MDKHCVYVWRYFIEPYSKIKNILMIAHSAGGACAAKIIHTFKKTVTNKVKMIAFTDAC